MSEEVLHHGSMTNVPSSGLFPTPSLLAGLGSTLALFKRPLLANYSATGTQADVSAFARDRMVLDGHLAASLEAASHGHRMDIA
jgi:hypothetical protein